MVEDSDEVNQSNLSALVDAIRSAGYHVSNVVMVTHYIFQDVTTLSGLSMSLSIYWEFVSTASINFKMFRNIHDFSFGTGQAANKQNV
jgi:hypothetical protein